MQFTAIPVSKGDSFLLQSNSKYILVDTGEDSIEVRDFLLGKSIECLDLIIITHFDSDHFGGLLEIIKSKIQIKQIWLPSIFDKLDKTIKFLNGKPTSSKGDDTKTELFKIIFGDSEIKFTRDVIKTHHHVLAYRCLCKFNQHYCSSKWRLFNFFKKYLSANKISLIHELLAELKRKKIPIVWLEYIKNHENLQVDSKIALFGQNINYVLSSNPFTSDEELILALTTINRQSLVFKYCFTSLPNILFCSDSNLNFLKTISLGAHSIVTAPHHGADANKNVYKKVKGNNLIYVRSDEIMSYNNSRPCTAYKALKEIKYCTICNISPYNKHQEVELNYQTTSGWISNSIQCNC
jgi:Metallo-beta-lactamase superfamily